MANIECNLRTAEIPSAPGIYRITHTTGLVYFAETNNLNAEFLRCRNRSYGAGSPVLYKPELPNDGWRFEVMRVLQPGEDRELLSQAMEKAYPIYQSALGPKLINVGPRNLTQYDTPYVPRKNQQTMLTYDGVPISYGEAAAIMGLSLGYLTSRVSALRNDKLWSEAKIELCALLEHIPSASLPGEKSKNQRLKEERESREQKEAELKFAAKQDSGAYGRSRVTYEGKSVSVHVAAEMLRVSKASVYLCIRELRSSGKVENIDVSELAREIKSARPASAIDRIYSGKPLPDEPPPRATPSHGAIGQKLTYDTLPPITFKGHPLTLARVCWMTGLQAASVRRAIEKRLEAGKLKEGKALTVQELVEDVRYCHTAHVIEKKFADFDPTQDQGVAS
ncbi:hypothetical protein [Methylocystis heyeri]|uniref:Uncharacterized protein n=1 Tax=Methylocystis heyeri TaxID=391905 RepID=A0A6B8KEW1_9HYPH|nr:hypothetical protein [Methylocystis heyeri]QGM46159.1 hypothetical protein H2LOC_010875 [Methylocystis heyeri]